MKKQILLISLFIIGITGLKAQSLAGTSWKVYEATGFFFANFYFDTDTLSFDTGTSPAANISTYEENGNAIEVLDISSTPCNGVRGHYTFSIQNDTLRFTLANDNCPSRTDVLTNYIWVRFVTGVDEMNSAKSINMYPNPTTGIVNIELEGVKHIVVSNLQGQIVKSIDTDSKTISLSGLTRGAYSISVFNNDKKLLTTRQIIFEK